MWLQSEGPGCEGIFGKTHQNSHGQCGKVGLESVAEVGVYVFRLEGHLGISSQAEFPPLCCVPPPPPPHLPG